MTSRRALDSIESTRLLILGDMQMKMICIKITLHHNEMNGNTLMYGLQFAYTGLIIFYRI